jgi:hypothetical protein
MFFDGLYGDPIFGTQIINICMFGIQMARKTRKMSLEVRRVLLQHDFWRGQQAGGAIVEGDGVRYDYRTDLKREHGTVIFRGGRKAGRKECFMLMIERDKTATLHSLNQAADCALDPNGSGRSMVAAALNLARQRGATKIGLSDISTKRITKDKSFHLSNMYFLTTGRTWYESIIPGLRPVEKAALIERWRQTAITNTWADVAARLGPVPLPVSIADIDIRAPGSAMAVLQRIKAAGADFFVDYEDDLLLASGIGNLHGRAWEAPLSA